MASLRICFASCSPTTSSNVRQPLVRIVSSMASRLDVCLSTTDKQMSSTIHRPSKPGDDFKSLSTGILCIENVINLNLSQRILVCFVLINTGSTSC